MAFVSYRVPPTRYNKIIKVPIIANNHKNFKLYHKSKKNKCYFYLNTLFGGKTLVTRGRLG